MKTDQKLRFYKFWSWFTTLFAIILFGYGFISSLLHLDIWGFVSWVAGFVVWCIGWFAVSKYFFGSYRLKW